MTLMLEPPIYSPSLKCRLTTVGEAIDYLDLRLSPDQQENELVSAAREALYRAEDTGAKTDTVNASVKLANALFVLEVARA